MKFNKPKLINIIKGGKALGWIGYGRAKHFKKKR